ncbi:hypothetical protein VP01_1778g3 [Puccinia sorghi]|uniref:Homeobox domain-containing protein n=1 Tax=Puccinia sorghi TaxID=27349 RepID=A0A0L6VEQ8_9BASI|nr:hypothetical protein VP01_1778g3 [Puccinia sorghi]
MSLPEADGIRAKANSGDCSAHEILPTARSEDRCEIPLAFSDNHLTSEWSHLNNLGAEDPAHTSPSSALPIPPLGFSNASSFERPANSVPLPPGTSWDPLLETSFPTQLEQMNLGIATSEDFLRPQFDFLNTSSQPELLSYEYNQPGMLSSPTRALSETDSLLPFENCSHPAASYHQTALLNPSFFSKPVDQSRGISPLMPFGQEAASSITSCSPASQPLPILSSPLGLEYYAPEPSRTASLLGMKRSLPTMNLGGITQKAHDTVKEYSLGFEGRGRALMQGFNVVPSSTSKYQLERFHDPSSIGEGASQLSWDMRTRSSSSRSPPCDQFLSEHAKFPDAGTSDYLGSSSLLPSFPAGFSSPQVATHGSSHVPEKNAPLGRKQNQTQATGNRDYPTTQKRLGSLIDIHHLTNHVPRRRLTVEQEQILLRRFAVQEYLSKREMEELAEKLKIPTSQLRTWFGNRRSKLKAAARQKAKMEAGMGHLTDAELRNLNKRS